jgi:hypothetical protein
MTNFSSTQELLRQRNLTEKQKNDPANQSLSADVPENYTRKKKTAIFQIFFSQNQEKAQDF